MPTLSVVVPCYNESESLRATYGRLSQACSATGWDYELLFVDDGSTDATWPIVAEMACADRHVLAVKLSRNHGHQLALSAGLSRCVGDRVLIIDADLQDPPELISDMMRLMDAGADVVYGQRSARQGETRFKRWTASVFYGLIARLSEVPIPRDTGDFRMVSRRVVDCFNAMPERQRYVRGMIAWIGFKQVPVLYDRQKRFAGETKYPLRRMIRFAVDALTSFSVMPLKVSIYVGLAAAGLALLLVVFTIVAWFFNRAVVGWTSVFAAISFFSAVQLFVLGIIGEYLGRLVDQGRGRPLFIIERVIGDGAEHDEAGAGQPERLPLPAASDDAGTPVPAVRA